MEEWMQYAKDMAKAEKRVEDRTMGNHLLLQSYGEG